MLIAQRHIMADFADQIAEGKYLGKRPRWGMHSDNCAAVNIANRLWGPSKTVEAYLHYCWCASEDLVATLWKEIKGVASALSERKS